jgi:7-cyano-7-deazaguanine synthase
VAAKSLILFSGGVDSTTALYWARARGGQVHALTFDYGQRHKVEVRMSRRTARRASVSQTILEVDLTQIGGSALTDPAIKLPRYRRRDDIKPGPPATYVPFRNGILISLAAAFAEAHGHEMIVCGFNIIDSPDYPDTRPAFVRAMEKAVAAGTKAAFGGPKIKIAAPFLKMTKAEIIRLGRKLGADYSFAISCYAGDEIPCGSCASCLLRSRAFAEAGVPDPLLERLNKGGRG